MEEISAGSSGPQSLASPDTASSILDDPSAKKLVEPPFPRGEQKGQAAARIGIPGNSHDGGAEVIAADPKTPRRRWLEPQSAAGAAAAEKGQMGSAHKQGGIEGLGSLPAGTSESPQDELVAEIRWLLVCKEGLEGRR